MSDLLSSGRGLSADSRFALQLSCLDSAIKTGSGARRRIMKAAGVGVFDVCTTCVSRSTRSQPLWSVSIALGAAMDYQGISRFVLGTKPSLDPKP